MFIEKTEVLTEKGFVELRYLNKYPYGVFILDLESKNIELNKDVIILFNQEHNQILIYQIEGKRTNQIKGIDDSIILKDNIFRLSLLDKIEEKDIPITLKDFELKRDKNLNISDNMIKLIVWLVTQAVIDNKGRIYFRYYNPEKLKALIDLLNRLKIDVGVKRAKGKVRKYPPNITYLKEEDSDWIKVLLDNKLRFPEFLRLLDKNQFKVFLEELIYVINNHSGSDLVSVIVKYKDNADMLQELCILNGYYSYINSKVNKKDMPFYVVHISDKEINNQILVNRIEDYSGCLISILKKYDKAIITRLNGKVAISVCD